MSFEELGFVPAGEKRDGTRTYTRRAHAYLVYWLVVRPDGTAELTWELALGQLLKDRGLAVSGQDELSLLAFPGRELRGPADPAWVAEAVEASERLLGSINFASPT